MANTYKFIINAVDVYNQVGDFEKVIYNVHWSYVAENENKDTGIVTSVKKISEPSPENFKPFEQLIQADIISWIEPLLDMETIKESVDSQIKEKVAPTKQRLQVPVSLVESSESLATDESNEETV